MLLSGWKCIEGLLQWLNSSWQSPGHTLISLASNSWIWKIHWVWFLRSDMSLTNQHSPHTEEREHSLSSGPPAGRWGFQVRDTIYIWVLSLALVHIFMKELHSRLCWQLQHLLHLLLSSPSLNPQCLAPPTPTPPFKSLSIPSPSLEVYLTINFYLKWLVWHIPHSNPWWPGKRKLESLEN